MLLPLNMTTCANNSTVSLAPCQKVLLLFSFPTPHQMHGSIRNGYSDRLKPHVIVAISDDLQHNITKTTLKRKSA